MQVVRGRAVSVYAIGPLLLQRNAENRHPAGLVAHHVQEIVNVRPFLNIVCQVEMRIIEFVRVSLGVFYDGNSANDALMALANAATAPCIRV